MQSSFGARRRVAIVLSSFASGFKPMNVTSFPARRLFQRAFRRYIASALVSSLALGVLLAVSAICANTAVARETVSISYQRSSTLLILLKRTGELEKRLNALGYDVSWHEFTNGLLESLNAGSVD